MKFRLLAIVVLAIGISSICLYGQNYPVFYEGAIAATDNAPQTASSFYGKRLRPTTRISRRKVQKADVAMLQTGHNQGLGHDLRQ